MLQNRVDPFGRFILTAARGAWMGNRGVIHNESKIITRTFKHKAWITCALEFKGRKRNVMTPDRWTELFFLDEATAFAAGHRPCFECRREDAMRFKLCWLKGNPDYNFTMSTSISLVDEIIHGERIDHLQRKVTYQLAPLDLPDGAFIEVNDAPYLFCRGKLFLWTPFGYDRSVDLPASETVTVLTPKSIVNALRAGYLPQSANLDHL